MSPQDGFHELVAALCRELGLQFTPEAGQESFFLEIDGDVLLSVAVRPRGAMAVAAAECEIVRPVNPAAAFERMLTSNADAAVLGQPTVGLADGGRKLRATLAEPLASLDGASLTAAIGDLVNVVCAWRDQIASGTDGAHAPTNNPELDWSQPEILRV
jgi:hypothetical protein